MLQCLLCQRNWQLLKADEDGKKKKEEGGEREKMITTSGGERKTEWHTVAHYLYQLYLSAMAP